MINRKFGMNRTQGVGEVANYVFYKILNGGESKWAELRGLRGFFVEQVEMDLCQQSLVKWTFWERGVADQTLRGRSSQTQI